MCRLGHLAQRIEQRGGYTSTRFYRRPSSWISDFMPQDRFVKRINRLDGAGNIVGAAYQR